MKQRPKATIEPNDAEERWEMYSVEPTEDHDGDGARQHIASIYDHKEACAMLRLWNGVDSVADSIQFDNQGIDNLIATAPGKPVTDMNRKIGQIDSAEVVDGKLVVKINVDGTHLP
jgi:hypothetical protein